MELMSGSAAGMELKEGLPVKESWHESARQSLLNAVGRDGLALRSAPQVFPLCYVFDPVVGGCVNLEGGPAAGFGCSDSTPQCDRRFSHHILAGAQNGP